MELLEIEKELSGENGEAAMKRYDRMLVELDERRAAAINAGLPPDEFNRAEALGEVIVIARKLLRLQRKK